MDKSQLETMLAETDNRCRLLFDNLSSAQMQVQNYSIELERVRGERRMLAQLIEGWQEPMPPVPPPVPVAQGSASNGDLREHAPVHTKKAGKAE